jgi:hypothetical protein
VLVPSLPWDWENAVELACVTTINPFEVALKVSFCGMLLFSAEVDIDEAGATLALESCPFVIELDDATERVLALVVPADGETDEVDADCKFDNVDETISDEVGVDRWRATVVESRLLLSSWFAFAFVDAGFEEMPGSEFPPSATEGSSLFAFLVDFISSAMESEFSFSKKVTIKIKNNVEIVLQNQCLWMW